MNMWVSGQIGGYFNIWGKEKCSLLLLLYLETWSRRFFIVKRLQGRCWFQLIFGKIWWRHRVDSFTTNETWDCGRRWIIHQVGQCFWGKMKRLLLWFLKSVHHFCLFDSSPLCLEQCVFHGPAEKAALSFMFMFPPSSSRSSVSLILWQNVFSAQNY